MFFKRLLPLTLAITLLDCSPMGFSFKKDPPSLLDRWDSPPKELFYLSVWTESHPLLERSKIWHGCLQWLPLGVICRWADSKDRSDVVIRVDRGPCPKDAENRRTLARAYQKGLIEVVESCGNWDKRGIADTVAHELGHVIGIWKHVPEECPEGTDHSQTACGPALMNSLRHPRMNWTTPVDAVAFRLRNRLISRLRPGGGVLRECEIDGVKPSELSLPRPGSGQ